MDFVVVEYGIVIAMAAIIFVLLRLTARKKKRR